MLQEEMMTERNNVSRRTETHSRRSMEVNDVEKRWNNPAALRRASGYCLVVGVIAAVVAGIYLSTEHILWALAVPVVFLVGGIGALVEAYRIWRRGGAWPIWQGAGWLLFALMLATMALPVVR
jgi:hypothetical protein